MKIIKFRRRGCSRQGKVGIWVSMMCSKIPIFSYTQGGRNSRYKMHVVFITLNGELDVLCEGYSITGAGRR